MSSKIIIFGLGNNQARYLKTKHNLGRIFVELVAAKYSLKFENKARMLQAKSTLSNGSELQLLYSKGFMNESGLFLAEYLHYFKYTLSPTDRLIVAHDDSDQFEGKVKLTLGGGHAGNKGVMDIYKHGLSLGISNQNLWRLKLGIRPAENKLRSETFVLSPASNLDEKTTQSAAEKMCLFLENQITFTRLQELLNSQSLPAKSIT